MEKFVQKVNLKLVKKWRKYWTVIQHRKGRGDIERDFIPSPSDVSYAEDQREELKKLKVTKYDEEIVKLMHSAVARRNIKFIREQFADDMFINEKRIDNLHQLGCFDYDDEIAEMRRKKEEAQNAEREAREADLVSHQSPCGR